MSTNRSRMAVIGPIIGFLLIYVIIRYGVTQFQTDMKALSHFGAVTIQEVQHTSVDELKEAVVEAAVIEQAEDDAATEVEVDAAVAEEEAIEEAADEQKAAEETAEEGTDSHD